MKLQWDRVEIDLVETTRRQRGFRGGIGWYWQECRLPPVGSFASLTDALRDLIEHIESGKLEAALIAKKEARRARGLKPWFPEG